MEALFMGLAMTIMPIGVTALIIHYKLKTKELEMRGSDPEVEALREETRAQLAEMQERLDFTERLLAGGPASEEDTSAGSRSV